MFNEMTHNNIYIYIYTLIALLTVILSGSIFGATFLNRKTEEFLPISIMSAVFVLYLFGLFGFLRYGVFVVLISAVAIILFSAARVFRKKKFFEFATNFFSPGFFAFLGVFVVLVYLNYNMVANSFDEFSHWMDCVKTMSYLDDFVTNPASNSLFKTYPPSMALFQYFVEKLYLMFSGSTYFCEWLVFLAYQLFALLVLFPFLRGFSLKKPLENTVVIIIALVAPTLIFSNFYTSIYIDPFVGVLAGGGFAAILFKRKKDALYNTYVALLCFCLVLAKETGLLFATFIAIAFAADYFLDYHKEKYKPKVRGILDALLPTMAVAFAKITWNIEMAGQGLVSKNEGKIDVLEYTSMFFLRDGTTYTQTVVDYFKNAFFDIGLNFGFGFFDTSYFAVTLAFIAATIVLFLLFRKYDGNRSGNRLVVLLIMAVCMIVYVYGLGATYVYNFSEYEALRLASYSRYMGMAYSSVWIVIVIGALTFVQRHLKESSLNTALFAMLIISIIVSPVYQLGNFVARDHVRDAKELRQEYDDFAEIIHRHCDGNDKIYFIHQGSAGFSYYVTRFTARPNWVVGSYSVGEPFYEGDIWTRRISSEELRNELLIEGYDYLAIYNLNDYFLENYASLFESPDDIEPLSIYKVNRNSNLLEKCS